MVILSHGQIVAETVKRTTKEFINKTIFEVVALSTRISLQKSVREIDDSCELIQDEPVDSTGKKRFSTDKGDTVAESVLKHLMGTHKLRIFEFQIEKPDLETIFFEQLKRIGRKMIYWEKSSSLTKRENSLRNYDAWLLGDFKDGVV